MTAFDVIIVVDKVHFYDSVPLNTHSFDRISLSC